MKATKLPYWILKIEIFEIPTMINGTTAGQQASSHFGVASAQSIARAGKMLNITQNVNLLPILSIIAPKNGEINDTISAGVGVHIAALFSLYPYLETKNSCANYIYPM